MNTPRSRSPVRYNNRRPTKRKKVPYGPDGQYKGGIHNDQIALWVGSIITFIPHIEERMINFLALLMGDHSSPARQVFRSLNSEVARIKIMRSLLEQAPINQEKGQEFDDVLDLFAEVKKKRNTYAHGLWWTHERTERVFIEEASPEPFGSYFSRREVKFKEVEAAVSRMNDLSRKLLAVIYPQHHRPPDTPKTSPEILPLPPREEDS